MKTSRPHLIRRTGTLLLLALSTGCAGYRLGNTLPDGIRTVHVPPAANKTSEPLIETQVTHAVNARIMQDGTLRLERARRADATLNITLTDFRLNALAFTKIKGEESRAREYRMWLTADVALVDRNGRVVAERTRVQGESTFFVFGPLGAGDLSSAKRTGLPEAAADLARQLVYAVVEHW